MVQHLFPPLATTSTLPPRALLTLADVQLVLISLCTGLMAWDWGCNLSRERRLGWALTTRPVGVGRLRKDERWAPGPRLKRGCFLASRYAAMLQAGAVIVLLPYARKSATVCSASRVLPFGFTFVSFLAHVVMALRIYRLFDRSAKTLSFLGALAMVDAGIQCFADGFVRPNYIPLNFLSAEAISNICYLTPSSRLFALAFISPSIFHHCILALTLYASWRHAQVERALGPKRSVMELLRREQVVYVLGICLINFASVILVLQPHVEYRTIFFLPSLCFTQIFLGRIHFALRAFLESRDDATRTGRAPSLHFAGGEASATGKRGWGNVLPTRSRSRTASSGEGLELGDLRFSTGDQLLTRAEPTGTSFSSPQTPDSTYTVDWPDRSSPEHSGPRRHPPTLTVPPLPPVVNTSESAEASGSTTARRPSISEEPASTRRKRHPPPRNRYDSLPPLTSLPPSLFNRTSLPAISVLHEHEEIEERDPTPPSSPGYLAPPPSPERANKARAYQITTSRPQSLPPPETQQKGQHMHHRRTSREHWTPPKTWETEVAMSGAGLEERAEWGNPFAPSDHD